jgi:hypothetical protein
VNVRGQHAGGCFYFCISGSAVPSALGSLNKKNDAGNSFADGGIEELLKLDAVGMGILN